MYAREEAKEHRAEVLHEAIRSIRFGTLVTADDTGAPQAVHVPFVLKQTGDAAVLESHIARANPLWKLLVEPRPTLVMFQGPQAYVRPGWYPAKQEHGKVVPTWSYVAVHARGQACTMKDDKALLNHIRELSDQQEAGQAQPWSVDDAPDGFISALSRGIVGLSLPVDQLDGVWKLNQHRSEADRLGMIDGLAARTDEGSNHLAIIMRDLEARKG
ncbi:MAG: FMN-binding negative transcriptional regulator [Beijerinckiaceae bacterium]